jgi:hypothetical protein
MIAVTIGTKEDVTTKGQPTAAEQGRRLVIEWTAA